MNAYGIPCEWREDGTRCNDIAQWIVWGCCEFYRVAMCESHARSLANDPQSDCEPIDLEDVDEYMVRSRGYAYEHYFDDGSCNVRK